MTASTATTVSPSSVRIARNTPWADGCCGPMFIVRRSLPPYPISTVVRGSVATLLERRVGHRDQHDRLHLLQQRRRPGDERLPGRVGRHFRAGRRAVVEVLVDPHVHGLVELTAFGLPETDPPRVLVARREHGLEHLEPLTGLPHVRAI